MPSETSVSPQDTAPAQVLRIRTSVRRSAGISAWLDGAALSATGLSTIVFALIESQRRGWTDLLVTALSSIGGFRIYVSRGACCGPAPRLPNMYVPVWFRRTQGAA
jgi:hypothetical protein